MNSTHHDHDHHHDHNHDHDHHHDHHASTSANSIAGEPGRSRRGWGLGLIALGLVLASLGWIATRCVVVVDETEFVLMSEFGKLVAVHGDKPGESGPYWAWPWQAAWRIDRRLQVFDSPSRELITRDKQNLEVGAVVAWKVADPVVFLRGAGGTEAAEAWLGERVTAELGESLGRHDLAALASTDAQTWRLEAITQEVLAAVERPALAELGISVADVRLGRFNHPVEVRPAMFDLIRSERARVSQSLRAEGEAKYLAITSTAEANKDAVLAEADAEAARIAGEADAEAAKILNEAYSKDPELAELTRTLDAYSALLGTRSTIVLSTGSPLLRLLQQGPASIGGSPPPPTIDGSRTRERPGPEPRPPGVSRGPAGEEDPR